MSIASMIDAKLVNEWPDERRANGFERALGLRRLVERPKSAAAQTPQATTAVPATAIGQLARWIPTESITLYVAFLGVLNPIAGTVRACDGRYAGRWAALGAFLVATVCIVVLVHTAKVRRTLEPFRWPVFEMSVSAVAFTAWAIALPDTPLNDFCGYKPELGAFIVLATTAIIGLVADALGRNVAPAEPAAAAAPATALPDGTVRVGR